MPADLWQKEFGPELQQEFEAGRTTSWQRQDTPTGLGCRVLATHRKAASGRMV